MKKLLQISLCVAMALLALPAVAKEKAKIVFVAGTKSHGYGAHEFNAGSLLMQKLLKDAAPSVETEVHLNGWPKDPKAFEGADAIILFMNGGGGHPVRKNLDQLYPLMEKGTGLMCMHYAVEVPIGPAAKAFLSWIGGYYESGYSINPHWTAKSQLNREHPISNGVKDFALKDEWYFNMRFREKMEGVTSVLNAVPDDEARSGSSSYPRGPKKHITESSGRAETLLWATERKDGGRGVGFTGAHFHWNFGDDGYRKLVLNAVLWTAGLDVPKEGVNTPTPTRAELEENQDYPKPEEKKKNAAKKNIKPANKNGTAFASKTISKKNPSAVIDADISGAKKLWLVVTDAGDGYGCDWANWVEPRLVVGGSEKKLTDMKWKNARADWGQVRVNKNAGGGALKVAGKEMSGIGTHANSVIVYDLPAGATRFKATAALDDGGLNQQGGNASSAQFLVYTKPPKLKATVKKAQGKTGGLSPEESLAGLDVADGLEASVFAAEPHLLSPSNMDIDHKGRVWITEIVNYRRHNGKRPEGDRILILEDTNGDGKADSSKVYYQGSDIDSPHGICVLGKHVIVSAKGKVFRFTDEDGDDKPDKKEVMFSGISGAQHDHGIHAFVFGPDGRLYFNFGNDGKQLMDKDGKPIVDSAGNEVSAKRNPYQEGMVFRCDWDGGNFETLGWNFRNNWEVTVDSFGTIWQSDNDDDGNRGVRINFVMEFGNYGYKDEFTGAGWGTNRTGAHTEKPLKHWHLRDPGVVPNLLQTYAGSPTGITIYEGDLLPKVFQGQMIHCDAGPNVTRAYPVKEDGAGYSSRMVNVLHGARDKWHRPADVTVAPDGSLFIADWYDPGVGGHAMGDLDRGRVFRVAPPGHKYATPKFDLSTADGAAEALKNPNYSVRYMAWTALKEMGQAAEPALLKLWKSDNQRYRARAAWLLGEINAANTVATAIADGDADIRTVGIRMARQHKLDVIPIITKLADDPSKKVLRECAIALRHHKSAEAPKLWAKLASKHDGKDRWYLEALGIAADKQWDAFLDAYLADAGDNWNTHAGRDVIWRSRAKKTPGLLAKIVKGADGNTDRYMRAFDFLKGPEKDAALQEILLQ